MCSQQALAIDIGGTSVKFAYVSNKGEITNKSSIETYHIQNLEIFLSKLSEIILDSVENGIKKVGISSLGMFEQTGMCKGGVENLPFLEGVNLPAEIVKLAPEVECYIINDGAAAALGEYWLGEAMQCDNFLCITLGTGIGGAIVLEGKPIRGSHFQSGEIGYSDYESEENYLERHYSTKGILEEAARQKHLKEMDGFTFVECVRNQDPICSELFDHWMEVLAKVLANYILLLDPAKVLVGGGISGQKEWICDGLNKKLQFKLPPMFYRESLVKAAKYGNDAGLLGAVEIFFNR